MAEMTPKEMQQKMELQLHEQYAVNNNASLSSIIVFMVGLLSAIGAYGHVFIHTANYFEDILSPTRSICFSLTQLSYALVAVIFVLDVMIAICIIQGINQRNEQFITAAIRYKYYDKNLPAFFPKNYTPKEKKRLNIVQGLYGELVRIGILTKVLIYSGFVYKLVLNICKYCHLGCPNISAICLVSSAFIICFLGWIIIQSCFIKRYRDKYADRNRQYKSWEQDPSAPRVDCFSNKSEATKSGRSKKDKIMNKIIDWYLPLTISTDNCENADEKGQKAHVKNAKEK